MTLLESTLHHLERLTSTTSAARKTAVTDGSIPPPIPDRLSCRTLVGPATYAARQRRLRVAQASSSPSLGETGATSTFLWTSLLYHLDRADLDVTTQQSRGLRSQTYYQFRRYVSPLPPSLNLLLVGGEFGSSTFK